MQVRRRVFPHRTDVQLNILAGAVFGTRVKSLTTFTVFLSGFGAGAVYIETCAQLLEEIFPQVCKLSFKLLVTSLVTAIAFLESSVSFVWKEARQILTFDRF